MTAAQAATIAPESAQHYTTRTRQDLQIDERTATEPAIARTFSELVFT
ncbi:hypothetical protein IVA87_09190 [Bradyrhizobium sp. 147]|nr:porin [Bradyrhizobium sp. 147]MCK1679620.1 hypothetical protein [Bradyrhizobium sp. 147]